MAGPPEFPGSNYLGLEREGPQLQRQLFEVSRDAGDTADKLGKVSFSNWNGGNLLRTCTLPAARTRHGSYNMDCWKSEQSAVLIFQAGSTIQERDMQEH